MKKILTSKIPSKVEGKKMKWMTVFIRELKFMTQIYLDLRKKNVMQDPELLLNDLNYQSLFLFEGEKVLFMLDPYLEPFGIKTSCIRK